MVLLQSARVLRGEPVVLSTGAFDPGVRTSLSASPTTSERERTAGTLGRIGPLKESVDDFQRNLIRAALQQAGGNWTEVARLLDVDRGNLYHRAKRLGLR